MAPKPLLTSENSSPVEFQTYLCPEEEFRDASLFLLEQSPQAALSFVDEITEAIGDIAEFPFRYPVSEEDIRVKRTHVHPYSIFYQILTDHILILSISHDSRDEGYWKDRL